MRFKLGTYRVSLLQGVQAGSLGNWYEAVDLMPHCDQPYTHGR